MSTVDTLILATALVGFVNASYFTAVTYGLMRPDPRWLPSVCRLDEPTCAAVVFTPQARLLGLPNSLLGQLYYLALVAAVLAGVHDAPPWESVLLAAAVLTVAMGVYLAWSLLFVIRVPCRLCFAGHAVNLVLLALLAL